MQRLIGQRFYILAPNTVYLNSYSGNDTTLFLSMIRYISYRDVKKITTALKPFYSFIRDGSSGRIKSI